MTVSCLGVSYARLDDQLATSLYEKVPENAGFSARGKESIDLNQHPVSPSLAFVHSVGPAGGPLSQRIRRRQE